MSYKPTYTVYKYFNRNADFVPCNSWIHETNTRFSTVWEALDGVRKLVKEEKNSTGKTDLELNPNTQYIIVEFFAPGESKIKCIVSQVGVMQEKFNYKTEEFSG